MGKGPPHLRMARTTFMTLIHFVERSERKTPNGTVFGYIPVDETCGRDVPVFAHAGCATSSQPVFIVVVCHDQRKPADGVHVTGYYDVSSETYTELDLHRGPARQRLDVRGSEHGRYLHDGFPPDAVPTAGWPIVTLRATRRPSKALYAIRRARAIIVATDGIVTRELVNALRRRLLKETTKSPHAEVYRRTHAILRQLESDMHDGGAVLVTSLEPFLSRFPVGRAVPSMCYEGPTFLEQPLLHGRASNAHRVIHERMGK